MSTQILYGVGSSVLREFTDRKSVIALTKLKNVSIEATGSEDKIKGGDSPYPIATFPKDKAIKISAENAVFDIKLLQATQGAKIKQEQRNMTEILTVAIPSGGKITLPHTVVDGTIVINGYTVKKGSDATTVPSNSQEVNYNGSTILFKADQAGKEVDIVYERTTNSSKTSVLEIFKDTMAKPFEFTHRVPIYDDNNTIVAEAQLTVFKAKSNNAFKFHMQPQQAFAPKVEFEALDPKRPDKKLWEFFIEEV